MHLNYGRVRSMPLDGKIVLRTYKERDEEQKEVLDKGKKYKNGSRARPQLKGAGDDRRLFL
jgi:hypothetical protein